jgi:hypothetical protein
MWNFWIVFSLGPKKFKNFRSNSVPLQGIWGNGNWVFDFRVSTLLTKRTPEFYITGKMHPAIGIKRIEVKLRKHTPKFYIAGRHTLA